ncbi:MAG: M20/M25/M40 family metallo-hydrolase [Candidatus Dormibacteraceae bacterium]
MASASEIDAHVHAHRRDFVEDLRRLCAFDSISNHGPEAVAPCRDWLAARCGTLTDRVETLAAGGLPALVAEVPGAGARSLLLYTHYDVQPVDPIDLWDSPPFEAAERGGRLYARGVCDDKADVMARIHAIETLKAVGGELPVTIRLCVEGEEEIGSRTFERICEQHGDRLRADGCLWESGHFDGAGRPEVTFGVRGLLYVQLRVRQLAFDQHSSLASLYPSAAAYLVLALASLRDLDMNVKIEGFADGVKPPGERDRRVMAGIDPQMAARREVAGFTRPVRDVADEGAIEQLLFTPTCNIAGVTTGYQGPGSKTVLPAEATAKLDFRLIFDQDPADVLAKLRRHLDSSGFPEVEIVSWDGEKPARADYDSAVGRAVIESETELFGGPPVIWPFMAATGPMHPIVHGLGVPAVMPTGAGRQDARVHAPNENIRIDDYLNAVRLMCRVFERFGASSSD